MKKHTATHWGKYAPPAYVANGFIGFRFASNPFHDVIGLLSGFTAVRRGPGVEAFSVIPTPAVEFSFRRDGCPADPLTPEIVRQTYDFSCGELETEAVLDCGGERVTLLYTVFCSRTSPTLLLSSLRFHAETNLKIGVHVSYSVHQKWAETVGETEHCRYDEDDHDGKCLVHSSDNSTAAGVCFRVFGAMCNMVHCHPMKADFEVNVSGDDPEVQIVTSYVPSVMHTEPHNQAHRMIKLAAWNGFARLREMNRRAWASLWESRITVDGAGEEWQDAIDASYFYLMSSASEFSPASVAPFGLSNPDTYEGHCFWDTESFLFMTPLFCAPDIARSMLDYRYRRLDAAEHNARLNGYRGIQFPWQSGASGCEVTVPDSGQAGGAGEQHVNLDVALAFDGYYRVTGDDAYLRERAWPVIRGVAEWIESRVEKTDRGYEILHVTGIEERDDDVPNDSYTNLMSAKLLRAAAEYSVMLGYGERKKWIRIADQMFIPSRPDGVLPQFEGMPERAQQPSTPLMSYFPYGYTTGDDSATFRYYIEHDMEYYLSYPMLSGFLGIFPAWLGDRAMALDYYGRANLTFFCEPFHACTEWSIADPADRIDPKRYLNTSFITARGSLLSGLIMGLTKFCPWRGGVNASPEEWFGENIVLPEGWNRITVGRIYLRGKAYRLIAEHGAKHAVLEELPE